MSDESTHPSVEYMLGKLDGKMDALKQSVDTSATSQGTFNATMQTAIDHVKVLINDESSKRQLAVGKLSEAVSVLEATKPIKHGWPLVWSSIAVVVSTLTVVYETLIHH
jgi:hypothetical protein